MSTCEVSLGEYDGDSATCYTERIVKARVSHQCYECRETIPAGASYNRVSGKWYDGWEVYRFCLPCDEALAEFSTGNARVFGDMWDTFRENWQEGTPVQACINRLSTVAAKEHMLRQWRRWKNLV